MNFYLATFFWVVAMLLIALSVVHFIKVIKARKKGEHVDLVKALVYVTGAITLVILLIFKPFDTSKLTKVFKVKPMSADTTATIITTSLGGSMGTTV
jgi:hypothetical protein